MKDWSENLRRGDGSWYINNISHNSSRSILLHRNRQLIGYTLNSSPKQYPKSYGLAFKQSWRLKSNRNFLGKLLRAVKKDGEIIGGSMKQRYIIIIILCQIKNISHELEWWSWSNTYSGSFVALCMGTINLLSPTIG